MDYHSTCYTLFSNPLLLNITGANQTVILIIILFVFLMLSFIASGAEVAFFSLTNKDINLLKTKQEKGYRRIIQLIEQPKILHATLTITSYFINISIIIISNWIINEWIPSKNLFWITLLIKILNISFILLLIGKILPKVMATQNNIRFAKDFGIVVAGLYNILNPISKWFVAYGESIEKKIGNKKISTYTIEELDDAIKLNNSSVTEEEKNILKGIVKFSNITVKQIMRARLDVNGIEYSSSFAEVKKQVEELHYSRLPVYKTSLDNIVGMMHTKDLLPYIQNDVHDWHQQIRHSFFVHEQKPIEDLLKEFQTKHTHFAVVVDEFGGTSGIVTLEDVMEEVIGDIHDEFDEEENANKKIDEYTYTFNGKTMTNDVCKRMNLSPHTFDAVKGDSESLAGLILELNGDIPAVNQIITCGDFEFTILSIEKNRIDNIKVTIKPSVQ